MFYYTTFTFFVLASVYFPSALAATDSSCCTIGNATYNINFIGIWANTTTYPFYPKDASWSKFLGAVHTPAVTLYSYGKLASSQVKWIAEEGDPNPMRNLLRTMPSKVSKIFISPGAYLPALTTYSINITVNNTFNLMSGLTMIAPSPDWCVGVDRLNFCTSSCGFVGNKTIDLYLWDAGTKAAATEQFSYDGVNTSVPIYQIKSTNNRTSVFYRANNQLLPPFAKLKITRLSQFVVPSTQGSIGAAIPVHSSATLIGLGIAIIVTVASMF